MLMEGGLTVIAFAGSFAVPRLANGWFSRVEHAFRRLARKRGRAVATVGLAAMLRAAQSMAQVIHRQSRAFPIQETAPTT